MRIEPSALGKVGPCSNIDHFTIRLYYFTNIILWLFIQSPVLVSLLSSSMACFVEYFTLPHAF